MDLSHYTDVINKDILIDLCGADSTVAGIARAANYSIECGGKRIRPVLCLMMCKACGGEHENALPLARAVEYVHTYSLIHDDLPCMDDDDYRRGKPSCHKQYGQANALLAGDALLTFAFETISRGAISGCYSCQTAVYASQVLASCAGWRGMIGGQAVDLAGEGKSFNAEQLTLMDSLKTGELIRAACVLGCMAAEASQELCDAAGRFAQNIGLAFQITDDILDVTGSVDTIGKAPGSDLNNGKSTYVSLLGVERCRTMAEELTQAAIQELKVFAYDTGELEGLARELCDRQS